MPKSRISMQGTVSTYIKVLCYTNYGSALGHLWFSALKGVIGKGLFCMATNNEVLLCQLLLHTYKFCKNCENTNDTLRGFTD